ncbi:type VI secretion system baseplate subunit TssF [Roseinatronobacter alkalisoli]|uniref:Type VI secretion system baseplate subunit TssF n=1 Tax=Roseinatronobacter alkalisoli TaxID=3028235 RepID=A0ABT5TCL9_9RHOB|nr:type VI secretion system baseplate subunit TssF [Roseinatronobacter sp. HJB301]MDD7972867.1 type VI secretion system baseplate subunit TssF [Roseinatronobacter sp. HJB301]
MRQEFLDIYERELGLLYDRAEAFALEFPGLADRLGGLARDRMDPGLAGLLEGAAFLAARVQLKLNAEFSTFTTALLDQLLPGYLCPIPSAALMQADPDFTNPDLATGRRFAPGSYLDASYSDRDRRVQCRFRLSAPLELWPLEIDRASYNSGVGALQALGLEVTRETAAGLRLRVVRRTGAGKPDPDALPTGPQDSVMPVSALARNGLAQLPVHLHGPAAEMAALYEQIFGNCLRITLRWLDPQGDPVFASVPTGFVEQIGFDAEEAFFPEERRAFPGFALLKEFHILPQKFQGFRLVGLAQALARIDAPAFDILFEFGQADARLPPILKPGNFRLYTVPAINLFSERCARVKIDDSQHDYLLSPQPSPAEHYEIHSVTRMRAYYGDGKTAMPVWPAYTLPGREVRPGDALYYSLRRRPRRVSLAELRRSPNRDYTGSEMLVSLHEPAQNDAAMRVRGLQADVLCTNRHLPAQLPIGMQAADFHLVDDISVALRALAGPTRPRDSLAEQEPPHSHSARPDGTGGARLWQLINCLQFNHMGLQDRSAEDPANGLREVLSLFADLSDAITARHVQGLVGSEIRPVTRSIRHADGFAPVRGLQVTLTFDDRAFEGTGFTLLSAVLDRFLADHVQVNSFTQTIIRSRARGEVLRFVPRSGTGPVL